MVLGLATNFGTVLIAAVIIGIAIALWHPAALSVLSARLAERRGLALSIHGMGGNLGNASPCANMAPPLLVLGARLELRSAEGSREVPLEEFFRTNPRDLLRSPGR